MPTLAGGAATYRDSRNLTIRKLKNANFIHPGRRVGGTPARFAPRAGVGLFEKHLARLGTFPGADDAAGFEDIDHAGGTGVA